MNYSRLFFGCTITQFSMKMNQIFSMCTQGLGAGKRVSDFLIYVLVQIL